MINLEMLDFTVILLGKYNELDRKIRSKICLLALNKSHDVGMDRANHDLHMANKHDHI